MTSEYNILSDLRVLIGRVVTGWMDRYVDGWMVGYVDNGWKDGWLVGCMDGRMFE